MRTSTCFTVPRPERADLALLQHAQDLRLQPEGHLADLVEEERAPVGELEEALLVLVAPVNAPFLCPKSSLSSRSRAAPRSSAR
jgi:hypothetical protein